MVAILFCAILFAAAEDASAADNGQLVSMSIQSNAQIMPRTIFTETWTIQNTGTTTWTATSAGYTLNLISKDSLGAIQLYTNNSSSRFTPSAIIGSGKSVGPGSNATFSINFIAPEAAGSFSDTFQLNNANSAYFGPDFAVQIVVPQAGSTNQYDRCRAVTYANNYAGYVVRDGYFWTNGSDYGYFGTNFAAVPTSELGDDCAHFVSSCIGRQSALWGGGLNIPSRVPPTYGEPGAARLVNTCLIAPGYATEVFSLSQLSPGDVIGWNWEGDTNIADLDHVTLYLGNGLLASHAVSALDVSATTFFQSSEPDWVWHLIHIYDAPTLSVSHSGGNIVLSWGTNWSGYSLYSATSPATNATWTKVSTSPKVVGTMNMVTNTMPGQAVFYRLVLP